MAAQMGFFDAPRPTAVSLPVPGPSRTPNALRPYQEEAVDGAQNELRENRSTLIVMPTGSGKTRVMTEIAARRKADRVLVVAHRDELLQQARDRFARDCAEHVGLDQAQSFGHNERIVVASIQTISKRDRLERFPPDRFDLVMIDECFAAGTMVDGRPIELIQPGDMVWSVDHSDGSLAKRRVSRLFRKHSSSLVKLWYDATETTVTGNHPYFVKGKGYVEANSISPGDLLCVCRSIQGYFVETSEPSQVVRETGVQEHVLVDDDGSDESGLRKRQNDGEQPDAQGRQFGANEEVFEEDRASSDGSGRKRNGSDGGRIGYRERSRMANASGGSDEDAKGGWVSDLLQTGCGEPRSEDCCRSRWSEPRFIGQKGQGREERFILAWARVDRIESVESPSPGGVAVYNFEVEGAHTYFANGALVHNCHHAPATTYKRVIDYFASAKVLGVTATPDRADEKAMGQVFDSVAYDYEIEDAIGDGYLCDVLCTRINIAGLDLSSVKTVAGDLNQGELDSVMAAEEVLLGVADATMREAGDRKTLMFTTSVANAHKLAEIMNRHRPDCARAVDGKTEIDERRGLLAGHKDGTFQFLVNVGIATEGYDDPSISCVAVARPTKSRALYAQMAGRGLRICDGKANCLILDFVGNSGRHKLASSLDVLGGRYTEEEEELAQKIVAKNPGMRARDALDQARAAEERRKREEEEAAKRAAIRAKAVYTKHDVNPFSVFHIDASRDIQLAERFGGKIASQKQLDCLAKFKIPVPPACTSALASKLIGTAITRRQKGLATFGQLKALQKYGIDSVNIGFKKASDIMDAIAKNGWKPLPFARLDALLAKPEPAPPVAKVPSQPDGRSVVLPYRDDSEDEF